MSPSGAAWMQRTAPSFAPSPNLRDGRDYRPPGREERESHTTCHFGDRGGDGAAVTNGSSDRLEHMDPKRAREVYAGRESTERSTAARHNAQAAAEHEVVAKQHAVRCARERQRPERLANNASGGAKRRARDRERAERARTTRRGEENARDRTARENATRRARCGDEPTYRVRDRATSPDSCPTSLTRVSRSRAPKRRRFHRQAGD